jgi:hypothetical protein
MAFNKIEVTRIYENLVTVSEMYKFGLNYIVSVDESEFLCVKNPASLIAIKTSLGLPQVLSEDASLIRGVPLKESMCIQNQGG